jgi:hypothetical protein
MNPKIKKMTRPTMNRKVFADLCQPEKYDSNYDAFFPTRDGSPILMVYPTRTEAARAAAQPPFYMRGAKMGIERGFMGNK